MKKNSKYLFKALGWLAAIFLIVFLWIEKDVLALVFVSVLMAANYMGGYFIKYFKGAE